MALASGPLRLPGGFVFAALSAGIKASGKPDLACAYASSGASAAAVFTRNRVVAAPVEIGREHLRRSSGRVGCVLVNAGNANCATGVPGLRACEKVCREAARLLGLRPTEVFPSSTGIIGVPLPAEKIVRALPSLFSARQAGEDALRSFARAIMTTDTRPKIASVRVRAGGRAFNILGLAKGAGMIHPQLATMLVYLFTDAQASAAQLRRLLPPACDQSFNCISVDGDTSTNDTVLLLASGTSGISLRGPAARTKFSRGLDAVCQSLAEQIVADGEGVQHVIRLHIEQARNREEALIIARAIAHSALVKTAWAGADPNWGRILAAVGRSGVPIDPGRVTIFFGKQQVCRKGIAVRFDHRAAHHYLSRPAYDIRIQLGRGGTNLRFLSCDLTSEYVHINADYST